jgi:hypothetical protein
MCHGVRMVQGRRLACAASATEIEKLPHVAKFLVTRFQKVFCGLIGENHQFAVEYFVEESRGSFVVGVGPAFRLGDDLIDNSQFF